MQSTHSADPVGVTVQLIGPCLINIEIGDRLLTALGGVYQATCPSVGPHSKIRGLRGLNLLLGTNISFNRNNIRTVYRPSTGETFSFYTENPVIDKYVSLITGQAGPQQRRLQSLNWTDEGSPLIREAQHGLNWVDA